MIRMLASGMSGYPKDLRLRVLAAVDRGTPSKDVVETFSVPLPTVKRWLKRRRETGGVEARAIPGRPSKKGAALRGGRLPGRLASKPDATLAEHREAFEEETATTVSTATMSRGIARLPGGWPLKESTR